MRNELFRLGVSQLSAGSNAAPGGYSSEKEKEDSGQFCLSDSRSLEEIIERLLRDGFAPSFCAACYRKERTGEKFMALAKPGTIKNMCRINAMLTLKEYLLDFGSEKIRKMSESLFERETKALSRSEKELVEKLFADMEAGKRDLFV